MLTLPNVTAPHAAFVDTVREDGNILLERKVMTIVIVGPYLNWTDFFNIYVIVNKVVALSALFSDAGIADNDSARLPLHNRVVNDTLFIINDIK